MTKFDEDIPGETKTSPVQNDTFTTHHACFASDPANSAALSTGDILRAYRPVGVRISNVGKESITCILQSTRPNVKLIQDVRIENAENTVSFNTYSTKNIGFDEYEGGIFAEKMNSGIKKGRFYYNCDKGTLCYKTEIIAYDTGVGDATVRAHASIGFSMLNEALPKIEEALKNGYVPSDGKGTMLYG